MATSTPSTGASTTRRLIDTKGFMAILNKRKTLKTTHIGAQVVLTVQGTGQFLPKGYQYAGPTGARENMFDRTIYNLQANSQLSMLRPETKKILNEAIKAESAGDMETATDLFNEYLNAIQVSFSVIEPSNRKFNSGDMVTAVVADVLAASGERQLVVNDVRYKAPLNVEATAFELSDLLFEEEVPAVTA